MSFETPTAERKPSWLKVRLPGGSSSEKQCELMKTVPPLSSLIPTPIGASTTGRGTDRQMKVIESVPVRYSETLDEIETILNEYQ